MEARRVLLGCLCWCAVAALPRAHALAPDRHRALQSQSAPVVADQDAWWKSQLQALLDKEAGQHEEHSELPTELGRKHVIGTVSTTTVRVRAAIGWIYVRSDEFLLCSCDLRHFSAR